MVLAKYVIDHGPRKTYTYASMEELQENSSQAIEQLCQEHNIKKGTHISCTLFIIKQSKPTWRLHFHHVVGTRKEINYEL